MATDTIPTDPAARKAKSSALYDASCILDMIGNELERVSETAYALATAEVFQENAQNAFYTIGSLLERLRADTKSHENRYDKSRSELSGDAK
ncbi:hypothetical protein GCM10022600_25070 [Qipengyuania pelagi]|uniref:Uncharacterized protein n=1 Tax=Qipengyuania pelagi TaxID=994320 RepID=A0A844Y5S0_9SPHN|nr:hypothetical protein [Qipengyuania pelagi]MXO52653.1 hypothetical protein [Qipengyuania pelagi]